MFSHKPRGSASQSEWDAISTRVQTETATRKTAVEPDRELADTVSAILFAHDPIGINFEENTDEYDAEAESIVLRLAADQAIDSAASVEVIVHGEFVRWFNAELAGPRDRYRDIAHEIWDLWSGAQNRGSSGRP